MSIAREIAKKVVKYGSNKKNIYAMFEKSLMEQGLLADESVKDLILGQFIEKGEVELSKYAKTVGEFNAMAGSVIAKASGTGKILPACTVTLDSNSKKLYDLYLKDWDKALFFDCKKRGKQIDKELINSSRIFVAELFIRLMLQALRSDSYKLLPPGKEREVWVNVMRGFAEQLIKNSSVHPVKLKDDFSKTVLQPIIIKWIDPLKEALKRIDEINKAEQVIYITNMMLENLDMQCKRLILAHLAYKGKNKEWDMELRSTTMVDIRLEDQENNSYEQQSKSNQISYPEKCMMAVLSKDSAEKGGAWDLAYKTVDLYSFGKINKETAVRRKLICISHKKKEKLQPLYAYLHFNTRLMSMIDKLGSLIKLLGLVPFLEKLEFGNLDNLIKVSLGAFKQLNSLEHLKYLKGSKLYKELESFELDYAGLSLPKGLEFSELKNCELITNIKEECIYTLKALMADSEALECPVITEASGKLLAKYLGEADRRSLGFDDEKTASVSSSSIIASKDLVESSLSRIFSVKALPRIASADVYEITEDYLKVYLKQIHLLTEINKLYDVFRKDGEVGFLSMYQEEKVLADVSDFVKKTKQFIDEFSNSHRLDTQEGHKYPQYWETRSQEVFCLKFLCVYAAVTGNNGILENFCRRLIKQPDLRRTLGLIQCYRGLKEKIGPLVEEVESNESYAIVSKSESTSSHAMISPEDKAVFLTVQEENARLKEKLKEKYVVIKSRDDEIDKLLKQIEAYKASNLEKDNLLNEVNSKYSQSQADLAKKDEEVQDLISTVGKLYLRLKKNSEKEEKRQPKKNSSSSYEDDDDAESFSQEGSYTEEEISGEEKIKHKRSIKHRVNRTFSSKEKKQQSKESIPTSSEENTEDMEAFSADESFTEESSGKEKGKGKGKERERHKKHSPVSRISIFSKKKNKSKITLPVDEKSGIDKTEGSAGAFSRSTSSTSLSISPKANE